MMTSQEFFCIYDNFIFVNPITKKNPLLEWDLGDLENRAYKK
jgi:hypothetical protein